jgi:hypothetical protein
MAGISESDPERLFSELNIVKHLPEAIRNRFKITILELCIKTLKFNKKLSQNPEPAVDTIGKVTDYLDAVEDFTKEPDHEYICKLINEFFG